MRVTILGGGFGLYGYLPALLKSFQCSIVLPTRYRETLLARPDICRFDHQIHWHANQEAILNECDTVIFALPPEQQFHLLKKCLANKNISHLFLEKPLASSPLLGSELLDALYASGKKFRIGYNFRYTNWGKILLQNPSNLQEIIWQFRAHHYAKNIQTWKRLHAAGGGALRFYGVHLIALLAEAGFCEVDSSTIKADQPSEAESWHATLIGPSRSLSHLYVETNKDNECFTVKADNRTIYSDSQPFEIYPHTDNTLDKRVPFLSNGLHALFYENEPYYDWYQQVNLLWQKIEASLV